MKRLFIIFNLVLIISLANTLHLSATPLDISGVVTNVSCPGGNNGAIGVTTTGGITPYTWHWNDGANTESRTNLTGGNYSVTVTDAVGATAINSFPVTQPDPFFLDNAVLIVTCYGGNDGSIEIYPSGGTPPYTYAWSNGSTDQYLTGVPAGNYSVTMNDNNGCSTTGDWDLAQPPQVIFILGQSTNPSCNGATNGSIGITISGGSPPYTYLWNDNVTTKDRSGLAPGTYTLTVHDGAGNCSVEGFTLSEPAPIQVTGQVTDATCYNQNDGTISINITNGSPAYSYLWSDGSTSKDRTGLHAGTYSVTVTDAPQCTGTASFEVMQPSAVITVQPDITDIICHGGNNGSISLNTSGGTPPYSWTWGNGDTTENLSDLYAGNYTVTITDQDNHCAIYPLSVSQPGLLTVVGTVTNLACRSNNNGAIHLNVTGGTLPYDFMWNTGATTQDLLNTGPGVDTVVVTDAHGCIDSSIYVITSPPLLVVTPIVTNVSCNGANDGSIQIDVSGGVTPYTFLWASAPDTSFISNLSPGSYSVTVTDHNGCQEILDLSITQPGVLNMTGIVFDVTCFGAGNGAINISVAGGTTFYHYNWSDWSTDQNRTDLTPGIYTLTVTDDHYCTVTQSFGIAQPTPMTVGDVITDVTCPGGNDGSITLTPTGGIPPYSYAWFDGSMLQNRYSLTAGEYQVVVADHNGCNQTLDLTVAEPPVIQVELSGTDVSCFGGTSGNITNLVTGGTPPYTYYWNDGITTQNRTGIPAGVYHVTVTDSHLCTATAFISISQPDFLMINGTVSEVTCFGANNGTITTDVLGGTLPGSFLWSDGDTNQDRSGLAPGPYTITVTDANGCTAGNSFTVTEPTQLTIDSQKTDVTCNAGSDGSIDITVTGATPPYTYLWSDGSTDGSRSNLAAGNYSLTVTDSLQCTGTIDFVIEQPELIQVNAITGNVSCNSGNNGSITLTVTGGVQPYGYAWEDGPSTKDRIDLTAGIYTVTVTDSHQCTEIQNYQITQPDVLFLNGVETDVTCNGGNNGSIAITTNGGTQPYNWLWSDNSTDESRPGLTAGIYSVTVTDANNCTNTYSTTVNQPAQVITVVGSITSVLCNGQSNGAVNLTLIGGTSPYQFMWSDDSISQDRVNIPAGTYTVTVTDMDGACSVGSWQVTQPELLTVTGIVDNVKCKNGSDGAITLTVVGGTTSYTYHWSDANTDANRSGLTAGTYDVTVTDAQGCTAFHSFDVTEPDMLVLSGITTDVSCNGGSNGAIDITVTGGTAPYTYLWGDGNVNASLSGLLMGSYSLTVTDNQQCTTNQTFTINEPLALSATEGITNVTCPGGSDGAINIVVNGGVAPFSFLWNDGDTNQDRSNITAGPYSVMITDHNNCTISYNYTVTQPPAFDITSVITAASCNGTGDGAIDLTITGGTPGYTYLWSDGSTDKDRTGLTAQTYTITVTDTLQCTHIQQFEVTQPELLVVNGTGTDISCNGGNDGTILVTTSGGTAAYTWAWDDAATTESRSGLTAGTYMVTATDAHGCTANNTFTLSEPNALTANLNVSDVSCYGGTDGSVTVNPDGGTAPYTYLWNDGDTNQVRNGLLPGTYYVTVTDGHNCTIAENATVLNGANVLIVDLTISNVSCYDGNNGSVTTVVSGGTGPYFYLWSNGSSDTVLTDVAAGNYSVTVSDDNLHCAVINFSITQPDSLIILPVQTDVSCNGVDDGQINLGITGGTGPFTYQWSDINTSQNRTNLSPGPYEVTVTDGNNCTATASFNITGPDLLTVDGSNMPVSCNGGSNGEIDLTVNGGTPGYIYLWGDGNTASSRTGLATGTYDVTVTDSHGCTATASFNVSEPDLLSVTGTGTDVSCPSGNNGTVSINVTGGTPGFTYLWSDDSIIDNRTGLTAGTYTVTVTDANNCTATASFDINQPDPIMVTYTMMPVVCNGESNGAISLDNVSGGMGPYSFLWSNDSTTQNISDLSAGDYNLTVTDNNQCTSVTTISVTQPDTIAIVGNIIDISCTGAANGNIKLIISGGVGPYTYLWDDGSTSDKITNQAPGTYSVTVTDANNCSANQTFELIDPMPVTGIITPAIQSLNCNGDQINPVQFIPDFYLPEDATISWTRDLTGEVSGIAASGTGTITGILHNNKPLSETVTFTITPYVNGCAGPDLISTVTVPSTLVLNYIANDAMCNGGLGTVTIWGTGGAEPYSGSGVFYYPAGDNQASITDANGCMANAVITVNEPPALVVTGDVTPTYCSMLTGGAINLTVAGGIPPYNFLWSDGSTDMNRNALAQGDYTVTVTDQNQCSATFTGTVGFVYTSPTAWLISEPYACAGSDHSFYVSFTGTPPFSITYNDGTNNYTEVGIFANPFVITRTINNNMIMTITAVNDLHCPGIVVATPAYVYATDPPTAQILNHDPICNGSSATMQIDLNGIPPWSISVFDGINTVVYSASVTPFEFTVNPQSSTMYTITALNDEYCTGTNFGTPSVLIVHDQPSAVLSGDQTVCEGENAFLEVSLTGNPPWNLVYYDGGTAYNIDGITASPFTFPVTPDVTRVYSLVSVEDAYCTGMVSGEAWLTVNPRPGVTWSGQDTVCQGQSATIIMHFTGMPPWNFTWSDGVTSHDVQNLLLPVYSINVAPVVTTTFEVTALQDNYCSSNVANPTFALTILDPPTAELSGPDTVCFASGGFLSVALSGVPPWTITWVDNNAHVENGIMSSPFSIPVSPSATTTYALLGVSDVYCGGSIQGLSLTVTVLPSPEVNLSGYSPAYTTCSGTDISFMANFTDGIPPFTITYYDQDNVLQSIPNLMDGDHFTIPAPPTAGDYNFNFHQVLDNNGCSTDLNLPFSIEVTPAPLVNAGPDSTLTIGNALVLQGSYTGGTGPYTIQWVPSTYLDDPSVLNPTCTPLSDITYTLQVTDATGCSGISQVNVSVDLSTGIFGTINYINSLNTPMNNVKLYVRNNLNVIVDSTITDATGAYQIGDLAPGNYTLTENCQKTWGGVNSTDALLIMMHFVQIHPLTGLKLMAGDVDGTGYVNSTDALYVAKRFTGQITAFVIGDWVFTPTSFTIPTANSERNLEALCAGDVNASFIPAAKLNTGINLLTNGELSANLNDILSIPILTQEKLELGAVSLVMDYPANQVEIIGVEGCRGMGQVLFHTDNGQLRISWYSSDPLTLGAGDVMFNVRVRVKTANISDNIFSIQGGSELADANARVLGEANLMTPKLLKETNGFNLGANYPNPFSQNTMITYTLPEDGKIKLSVYNALGEQVKNLADQNQAAGNYNVVFDGSNLPAGVYWYTIELHGVTKDYKQTHKMAIVR